MPALQSRTGETIESIVREYRGRKGVLLHLFHRIQDAYGYVPQEAMQPIAEALHMHPSTVFGTLTFYTEFRTEPPPPVLVGMCLGPTCHLRGAEVIKQIVEYQLGLDDHGHAHDNTCGLHIVQCAGHCHLSPLIYVNEEPRQVEVAQAVALTQDVQRLVAEGVSA